MYVVETKSRPTRVLPFSREYNLKVPGRDPKKIGLEESWKSYYHVEYVEVLPLYSEFRNSVTLDQTLSVRTKVNNGIFLSYFIPNDWVKSRFLYLLRVPSLNVTRPFTRYALNLGVDGLRLWSPYYT